MAKAGVFRKGDDPRRTKNRGGGTHTNEFRRMVEKEAAQMIRDAREARRRQAVIASRKTNFADGPAVTANKSIIDAGARVVAESLPKRQELTGAAGGPIVSQNGLVISVVGGSGIAPATGAKGT